MEIISKILKVLEIAPFFVLLQMLLVITLSFLTAKFLIRPILKTFAERENRTTIPMEQAREMILTAEQMAVEYEERLQGSNQEAITRKRARIDEVIRSERKLVDGAKGESERSIEDIKEKITGEKEEALVTLRQESQALATAIVEKILGRSVA